MIPPRQINPLVLILGVWITLLASFAQAQDVLTSFDAERAVSLQTPDGNTQIVGELQGIEDGQYVVRTEIGELRVSVDAVECSGAGCPKRSEGAGFVIHVLEGIELSVVTELLRGYAADRGAQFEFLESQAVGQQTVRLTLPDSTSGTDIVYANGTSGLKALLSGAAQISIQDVSILDEVTPDIAGFGAQSLELLQQQRVIGRDGLVLAVNPRNPVRNLSRSDIARVFSGEVTNWLELGGGNVPITVSALNDDHRRSADFTAFFLNGENRVLPEAARFSRDSAMQTALMQDEGSIGYLARSNIGDAKAITLRESCGLLTEPDSFTIKAGGYPLSNPVFAYAFDDRLDANIIDLLDWLSGPEAQPVLRQLGFADTGLERSNLEDMGMMLVHSVAAGEEFNLAQYTEMLRVLRDAQRLSVAFRFETGAALLDAASIKELELLAAQMDAGAFEGLELLLVGFADSTGPAAVNTTIAGNRAEAVRKILLDNISERTTARVRMRTLSYGELFPLACNDDEAGRANNRRVEIWVRGLGVRDN